MVACNHYLVFKFQTLKLGEKIGEVFFPSIVSKISSVNEDVSTHAKDLLERLKLPMSVRNDNNF